MSESFNIRSVATHTRVIAAALASGRSLDWWSLAFVMLALLELLWVSLPLMSIVCLLLSILAGGAQKIFALRVAFDEALFRYWAESWDTEVTPGFDSTMLTTDLSELDQTLFVHGLLMRRGGAERDLESRSHGALHLLKKQILFFTIQFAAIITAIMFQL